MMSIFVSLTLIASTDGNEERPVQTFAERLKVSHELKKPSALDNEEEVTEGKEVIAIRNFQIRMTQSVAKRR